MGELAVKIRDDDKREDKTRLAAATVTSPTRLLPGVPFLRKPLCLESH